MATPEENRQFMERLDERIKKIEERDVPGTDKSKNVLKEFEDTKNYNILKVGLLHAGLPVFKVAPTYTGLQGEIVLYDNKVDTRAIYIYLNGAWYSIAIT